MSGNPDIKEIKAELAALEARGLELEAISENRPWNLAEITEIYSAAERDSALRSQLASCRTFELTPSG